ncbi:expressed unknown protein [Seminavis robusta]|uniref:LRRK2 ARM repeat domain-containing protein n=1 Tax=Seminavis robusta TaxID=568900 RepID=A0A9N8HK47_9STRA|nr:expressed unknown protein [Seminavis robusta]|eukprot:Sro730_g193990.1 n/a (280) ;mRNA; f:16362-17201
MASSEPASKRRRTSGELDPQPAVVGSSPTVVQPTEEPDSGSFVAPKLEEIPQLLFVELQKDKEEDIVAALKQLFDLFSPKDKKDKNDPALKNWEKTKHLGPPSFVVVNMRKWAPNHYIQLWSCRVLSVLMVCSKNSCSNNSCIAEMATVESGGVEAVLNAMKSFPQSEVVIQRACCALRNTFLSLIKRPKVVKDCAARFVEELEGVAVMLQTIKEFPEDTSILEHCCLVFKNLAASFKQHHGMFIDAGVVEAVASVQKKHSDNEELKEATKKFMSAMFS